MSTKHKQQGKRNAVGLLEHAQRALQKGDAKQALKDAKVSYRQEPSPEARRLLERAYLARGRQLQRAGLQAEAQAVVEDLLALGVTDAEVSRDLPVLLVAVGLHGRVPAVGAAAVEEDEALQVLAADHAVLRPESVPASLPAIRQGATAIRNALAALEAGEEAQAAAVLSEIPRTSPFADWKLFVRGLAAYYRQDAVQMQANWDRLDPARFAARIAAALKAVSNPGAVAPDDYRLGTKVARLTNVVRGGPVLDRLQKVQEHLSAGQWPEAIRLVRASASIFGDFDPALPQRIATVLYAAFVHKGLFRTLKELSKAVKPLPIDPHWNRGLALAAENDDDAYLEDIENHWRAYLNDLAEAEFLTPSERTLAQALVWLHWGQTLTQESVAVCPTCGVCHEEPDSFLKEKAVECFENGIRLAPDLAKAYRQLAWAHQEWGEPDKAVAAHRRLLERFPDELDSLLFLARHHSKHDEPLAAREFLLRAQRLKPLDAGLKRMVRDEYLASARHHALAGRWDEGRAELDAAEAIDGPPEDRYRLSVHHAVLELKAGDFGLTFRLLDQAEDELGEAAPVWLLTAVEGARYDLPKGVLAEVEKRWTAALKKGRSSSSLGEMSRIAVSYREAGMRSLSLDDHASALLDVLKRCARVKWEARDLRNVANFLLNWHYREEERGPEASPHADPSGAMKLLEKFTAKARTRFPDDAFLQMTAGTMEWRKGPAKCNRKVAEECFRRVLQLTEGSRDPDELQFAKRAREKLDDIEELELPVARAPIPLPPEDDEADEPFEPPEFGDKNAPLPPEFFKMFMRMCRERGLDPEAFLDELGGNSPFRFRGDRPGPQPKNRR